MGCDDGRKAQKARGWKFKIVAHDRFTPFSPALFFRGGVARSRRFFASSMAFKISDLTHLLRPPIFIGSGNVPSATRRQNEDLEQPIILDASLSRISSSRLIEAISHSMRIVAMD
jgi:hypothetical protein